VFERFDSALSLKKSLEIDFSSEKTVKIKKIAEYIAVSNGKTLRLLDGQLSDDYKTFTFEDDIYDFSIKDNIIVTALGELGVNFKEIEN